MKTEAKLLMSMQTDMNLMNPALVRHVQSLQVDQQQPMQADNKQMLSPKQILSPKQLTSIHSDANDLLMLSDRSG